VAVNTIYVVGLVGPAAAFIVSLFAYARWLLYPRQQTGVFRAVRNCLIYYFCPLTLTALYHGLWVTFHGGLFSGRTRDEHIVFLAIVEAYTRVSLVMVPLMVLGAIAVMGGSPWTRPISSFFRKKGDAWRCPKSGGNGTRHSLS